MVVEATAQDSRDDPSWFQARITALAKAHHLSGREQQILAEMARGVHLKEIGARIGCSYASVRTHVRRMGAKLRCSGAKEVLVRFFLDGAGPL
ncbi:MAG TPA: helix-turn-helix transcriptional regulator [Polyangiaceae bacterium]|jgi:DNA-binding CsgD family transcriptional regulator